MNEISWKKFKAKFDGKEQKSFEYLCYLLFCREFNKHRGIFRYFNQAGIEAEPIQVKGEWIGFQAKFYETKINNNKSDIKDSIKKAKSKNSSLNKIYFYINQEFSESKIKNEKEPQYKREIETFAKSNGVEIVWRVPSHLEAQLSLNVNENLAQYFFSLGKGFIDFISELNSHTVALLKRIRSEIEFDDTEIKIDRSAIFDDFQKTLENSSIVILSGEGGVGKTAFIKDFYYSVKTDVPFFVFRAAEFNTSHINDFFKNYGNFTIKDFVEEYKDIREKYIVIDSAEKLSDSDYPETFQEFLSNLIQHSWKIIFTTRYSYLDDLKFQFIEHYRLNFQLFNFEKLEYSELEKLSNHYNFIIPNDEKFSELLKNPFYLTEYLQNYRSLDEITSFSKFKNHLWNKKILKSFHRKGRFHLKREECFIKIAKKRADTGSFFVKVNECDENALMALEEDEIIEYDSGTDGHFITHDIYEEWALDKIIERSFHNSTTYVKFFNSLNSSLPIRRAFRNWLSEKLLNNRDIIRLLIEDSFTNDCNAPVLDANLDYSFHVEFL